MLEMEIETIQEFRMPKVSVIIPVYGVEKYIERCARSLFEQTLDDIEFLFIDDCTPDNSIDVLNNVLSEYPHRKSLARVVRMEQNSGQAAVRMRGIKEAKGEYLMFCDSDDWVENQYCGLLYIEAINSNSEIVVCDYSVVDDENNVKVKSEMFPPTISKEEMMKQILNGILSSSLCNKIFKRTLFVDKSIVPPKGNMGEDMILLLQALFYCNRVIYIKKSLYNYYFNENSITKSVSKDNVYKRFQTSILNTQVMDAFFQEKGLSTILDDEFTYLKLRKLYYLQPLLSDKKIFTQWKSTYPDLFSKVIRSQAIPFKEKISYYLTYFGLRSILK